MKNVITLSDFISNEIYNFGIEDTEKNKKITNQIYKRTKENGIMG